MSEKDYSTYLTKLCYIITRCLDCELFPCNIFRIGNDDVELSRKEYSCLREIANLLEITRKYSRDYKSLFCELLSRIMPKGLITLEKIINTRYIIARTCLEDDYEAAKCVLESIGLKIISELLDVEDVEDLYVTGRGVYVVKRGLIIEPLDVKRRELSKIIKRFIELTFLAGHDLNFDNPSALYSINIGNIVRLRVSIDVWPCTEDAIIHVRIHRRPLTLTELAKLNLASQTVLKKIVKRVKEGDNLIIIGPPGSGKTTLLNAILLEVVNDNPNVKIVCVDEADEIWLPDNVLFLKYRSVYGRVREIEKVLHRGGGMLVIGELREREHYEAFRIGLRSGLQVLATVHGKSINDVLSKFESYGIDYEGSYVVLGFVGSLRRIVQVSVPVDSIVKLS
ncbi:MAG: type II/IV secretion system ATPase subunit [Crenarchaeota archaeon]|nr:type II/IV secretion system ATPase subunit [Thermoproteota archaeon]